MPTLYEFPPTRSNRVRWMLEEIGLPFTSERVDFMTDAQQSEAHRALHPLGKVPVWQSEQYVQFESVAIILQLADENTDAGLIPALGTAARAHCYQWCVFAGAELDHHLNAYMKHTMHLPTEQRDEALAERSLYAIGECANVLEGALMDRTWLLGDRFSVADVAIGYDADWAAYTSLLSNYPQLTAYYLRLAERPAFQNVFEVRTNV